MLRSVFTRQFQNAASLPGCDAVFFVTQCHTTYITVIFIAVIHETGLKQFDSRTSSTTSDFNRKPVHVGFVVDEVSL
jgi:hypothetical protein